MLMKRNKFKFISMKHIYLILFFLLTGVFSLSADPHDGKSREDKMKEMLEFKMKYLAQEMDLKGDQRKEFFKIYKEMADEKRDASREADNLARKIKKEGDNASEEDYQKLTAAMNEAQTKTAAIDKKYDEKFSEFLSSKQIYKMKEAEKAFRKKLEDMRHKKHGKIDKNDKNFILY